MSLLSLSCPFTIIFTLPLLLLSPLQDVFPSSSLSSSIFLTLNLFLRSQSFPGDFSLSFKKRPPPIPLLTLEEYDWMRVDGSMLGVEGLHHPALWKWFYSWECCEYGRWRWNLQGVFNGHSGLRPHSQSHSGVSFKALQEIDAAKISFALHFHMSTFRRLQIQFWMWWTVYGMNSDFVFCLMVIVAPEVAGLTVAVITSYPDACSPFSDVHSPPSMSTGPSISLSIVAVGQIGLEAHHYHPALSLLILPAGNYTGAVLLGGTAACVARHWFGFRPASKL